MSPDYGRYDDWATRILDGLTDAEQAVAAGQSTVLYDVPQMVQLTAGAEPPPWLQTIEAESALARYWRISPGAKADEKALWAAIQAPGITPRFAGRFLGIPPRRVRYLCEKWARRRLYNYGVSSDLGWVER